MRDKDRAYLGRTTIVKAMQSVEGLSDELLLAEDKQDMHVAENAAAIANKTLTTTDLPAEAIELLQSVIRAIEAKASAIKDVPSSNIARRVPGM